MSTTSEPWKIWIDTGGTFTDCIGISPGGTMHRLKVLSSSALRGSIAGPIEANKFSILQEWEAPSGFIEGFRFNLLDINHPECHVTGFDAENGTLEIDTYIEELETAGNVSFEVISHYEAPILAARLLTGTLPDDALPPLEMRLATTKGTNALLEGKGAPTMLLITEGFGDLMLIGNQKRPDLFALNVQKPSPVYNEVLEVSGRLSADGKILQELSLTHIDKDIKRFLAEPDASFAICLMHSYKNPDHELSVKDKLIELGAEYVSVSSELAPFIKILPRAETTLVNASLQPVLRQYLDAVANEIQQGSIHVMTSAGGLVNAGNFKPKDSLLSGPAGGVVGASSIGKQNGFNQIISFDMGGTSTDVARFDHGFDYIFEHSVGEARLNAPALSVETVAAGGGSICSFDGSKLSVGPESAGAYPGPACYGAGGPLTLTDINLLLGRLEADNFGIPINPGQSEERLEEVLENIQESTGQVPKRQEILEGFLQIANERMADAIRKVSMRKGYDPSGYALVAFGGAGAQHACAIADELDIKEILIPSDAGLLSAYGLGNAVIEQFAEQQILKSLDEMEDRLPGKLNSLEEEALQKLRKKEGVTGKVKVRKKLVFMRLKGQDSTLEVEYSPKLADSFRDTYKKRYGHWIEGSEIEIESIRVVASTLSAAIDNTAQLSKENSSGPARSKAIQFAGKKTETPVFIRSNLDAGQILEGPALVLDPYSTIVLEPGWRAEVQEDATLHLSRTEQGYRPESEPKAKSVALELFTNRFTSIAEEMGEMLKRTARSVNVKERMDFSCALLNPEGELVVNAPHIPVHLGALGLCVRKLKENIKMQPSDVVVTNHPAYGGSHLPDITVVTPIFTESGHLLGYAASRAHHAEIGGTRPGSMPPDARSLAEEGVVIPPMHLIRKGNERLDEIRKLLTNARYPTRAIEENMADLQAAIAANHRGAESLRTLAEQSGVETMSFYMSEIKKEAAGKCREMLKELPDRTSESIEFLDDGSRLKAKISKQGNELTIDFTGTGEVHPGNLNATPAIVNSVIMYVLRLLINQPLPLNEGLLEPVTLTLPECMLNPVFRDNPEECPAVVGGNTETSQRLVDLLLKPFEQVACSQGTMNNVLFGNEEFGYYETIGGGTGAGPGFDGADAVHHHMTNTAGTDPEILEHRYPVRINRYAIRKNSGGAGKHKGGDGIERELTFLKPVSLSVLTQHRAEVPYGIKGGKPGLAGRQWVIRKNGETEELSSIDGKELEAGDKFIIQTPGGGGFGKE